ncbi:MULTISPECIES: TetR family transcriptional regulator [unclassified Pseudoclavibacter]|uniref:TetR family transcriptional regulator n=1 Tax=unclassified Pseudoclavibacter TaxID=2615177 RepID=UPI001BA9DDE2|nr:TetR family transcriptional regulator [Pseudoclavibacter sp. Marseille-Q4354]MBS3180315.1 TetR family transcriptional regulator [Pseudoclavibacter sp. Marseille-Q4354]
MTPRGPAGGSGLEKLSRTEIVTTALEVLDEHGLPNLSMRRISDYLEVQPSALYWHFPNKQSLLAAVSDRILHPLTAETWLPPGAGVEPGTRQTRTLAIQLRTALLSRRDGAELVSSSFALDLLTVDLVRMISGAAHSDFALGHAGSRTCADAVVHYTIGQVFHEQQQAHAAAVGALQARTPDPLSRQDPTDRFTAGLDLILAGAAGLATDEPSTTP